MSRYENGAAAARWRWAWLQKRRELWPARTPRTIPVEVPEEVPDKSADTSPEASGGPTVGRWIQDGGGDWYRRFSPESRGRDFYMARTEAGGYWEAWSRDGDATPLCIIASGAATTLSAAMLAADDALRAAGERLPETVWLHDGDHGDGLYYVNPADPADEAWVAYDTYDGYVWRSGTHEDDYGTASTLPEALDILDARGVDTAIARAQMREREREDGEPQRTHYVGDDCPGGHRDDVLSQADRVAAHIASGTHLDAEASGLLAQTMDEQIFGDPTAARKATNALVDAREAARPMMEAASAVALTAERKAAAEGWGWCIGEFGGNPPGQRWVARTDSTGQTRANSLPALLDAIEAREVEAAKGRGWRIETGGASGWWQASHRSHDTITTGARHALITAIHEAEASAEPAALPLAGVVLSGDWMDNDRYDPNHTDETMMLPCVGCIRLEGPKNPLLWSIWHHGTPIATGIGTREDAIEAARKLGATVRGDA